MESAYRNPFVLLLPIPVIPRPLVNIVLIFASTELIGLVKLMLVLGVSEPIELTNSVLNELEAWPPKGALFQYKTRLLSV